MNRLMPWRKPYAASRAERHGYTREVADILCDQIVARVGLAQSLSHPGTVARSEERY